jgi:error-prone DNA polymerase
LVADARRHGVEVRRPDVNASGVGAGLEATEVRGRPAIRLGLSGVRTLGKAGAERVVAGQPYRDLEDLARRAELTVPQLEALATAGATASLDGGDRRATLWAAGPLGQLGGGLPGIVVGADAPPLPAMDRTEQTVADLWATGLSVDSSLTELVRDELERRGVVTAAQLRTVANGARVSVAGVVTHRQRPETARGITFVNLEDETGLVNVVCSVGVWARHRKVAQSATALVVRGTVESASGVVNVVAERIEPLVLAAPSPSRDFC